MQEGEEIKAANVFESHLMRQRTKILAQIRDVQDCGMWLLESFFHLLLM